MESETTGFKLCCFHTGQRVPPTQREHFAARQRARHVPCAADGLHTTDHPRGYRVRILAVEAYPFGGAVQVVTYSLQHAYTCRNVHVVHSMKAPGFNP
jgi:hypothetical protein